MTPPDLAGLIAHAVKLAGGDLCADGHEWKSIGGRHCYCTDEHHVSQTVYRCLRCEDYDYGERGGPGFAECAALCGNRGPDHFQWRISA